jgi:hypothetical protein
VGLIPNLGLDMTWRNHISYIIVESDLKILIYMIMGSCTFGDSHLSFFFFAIDDSHLIKKILILVRRIRKLLLFDLHVQSRHT